jgi:hypothetical protein
VIGPETHESPEAAYEQRLGERKRLLERETARYIRLGNVRLAFVAGAAISVWLVAAAGFAWWPMAAFAGVAILIVLFVIGDRLTKRIRFAQRGVDYYERALVRVRLRRNDAGETGERFIDPNHPYAVDLDVFGKHSLFQFLSTCRTRAGENLLAKWLLEPADAAEIASRHDAVEDMRGRLDLREDLAVLGEDFRTGVRPDALAAWATAPRIPIPKTLRFVAGFISLVGLAFLVWWTLTLFGDPRARIAIILTGLIEGAIFFRWRNIVNDIATAAQEPGHDLALLSAVLARLEQEKFSADLLMRHRASLEPSDFGHGKGASHAIDRLNRLMELLASRDTWFVRIFGPLILWTTQVSFAVELWRQRYGHAIPQWLEAVAEFEAIGSLAALRFEHPADALPEITDGTPVLTARALSHPLLPECVPNDVALGGRGALLIVSGSNMSGKSTWLRTVGLNAVLALAGGPVRADYMQLSILSIGASIRTTDSLDGGISRFYAEILRIRQILDLRAPVLFLLDELLAGTNSHDRRIGAEAIFRGLVERHGIGFATTHDLALAGIAADLSCAANVHFEDFIQNGQMRFDYRMRPGVVTRSNALELMRSVGLKV